MQHYPRYCIFFYLSILLTITTKGVLCWKVIMLQEAVDANNLQTESEDRLRNLQCHFGAERLRVSLGNESNVQPGPFGATDGRL